MMIKPYQTIIQSIKPHHSFNVETLQYKNIKFQVSDGVVWERF